MAALLSHTINECRMGNIKKKIINIGKSMLVLGLQNTHSGNISVRDRDKFFITKTNTMKGHLKNEDVLMLAMDERIISRSEASTETRIHQKILKSFNSVIHAHSLSATVLSNMYKKITPLDYLGINILKFIPVLDIENNSDSEEKANRITEKLKEYPAVIIKNHGPFVRGSTVEDAFFNLCIADYSAEVLLGLRMAIKKTPEYPEFNFPVNDSIHLDNPKLKIDDKHWDINKQNISADIFHLKLSPFQSGSLSIREGTDMIYSSFASLPLNFKKNIFKIGIRQKIKSNFFLTLHQAVYQFTRSQAVIFTHSPSAVLQSIKLSGEDKLSIVPTDIEGKYLYPRIPIVLPGTDLETIVKKVEQNRIVVITGMGALSVGQSLQQCIRHTSTLKNICMLKTNQDILKNLGINITV